MHEALAVLARLNIPFVILAVTAQALSYAGSGYLLRSVVRSSVQPVSTFRGAMVTLAANSVGTLGGGALGTAGTTYLWLRRHGVNRGAAGLGGWIPIFVNLAALAAVSLGGLMVLIHLKKSSTVLVLGLSLVMLVLLVGLGALGWLVIHRARLHGWATATAKFAARLLRKPFEPVRIEIAVAHLLEGWDALVQGGWRGAALGAIVNIGGDMFTTRLSFPGGREPYECCAAAGGVWCATTHWEAHSDSRRRRSGRKRYGCTVRPARRAQTNRDCGGAGISPVLFLVADGYWDCISPGAWYSRGADSTRDNWCMMLLPFLKKPSQWKHRINKWQRLSSRLRKRQTAEHSLAHAAPERSSNWQKSNMRASVLM